MHSQGRYPRAPQAGRLGTPGPCKIFPFRPMSCSCNLSWAHLLPRYVKPWKVSCSMLGTGSGCEGAPSRYQPKISCGGGVSTRHPPQSPSSGPNRPSWVGTGTCELLWGRGTRLLAGTDRNRRGAAASRCWRATLWRAGLSRSKNTGIQGRRWRPISLEVAIKILCLCFNSVSQI